MRGRWRGATSLVGSQQGSIGPKCKGELVQLSGAQPFAVWHGAEAAVRRAHADRLPSSVPTSMLAHCSDAHGLLPSRWERRGAVPARGQSEARHQT